MKIKRRTVLFFVLAILLGGIAYGLYVWNKPHRDVRVEKGIAVTAVAIFDSFTLNETRGNQLYLDKAIEVTGEVSEVKKNQDGNTVVYLKTSDPVYGINCTFKEDPGVLEKGMTITFKGICRGFLSDVIINEGVIVKK